MPTQADQEFNNPAAYPYLSVASPSCHDVSPLRAWWVSTALLTHTKHHSLGPSVDQHTVLNATHPHPNNTT
jgi:4-alpha-glucanotransferase